MKTETPWHPTRRSDMFDVSLTAVFGVTAAVSLYMGGETGLWGDWAEYSRPLGILLVSAVIAPMAIRRRYPVAALSVATVAFTLVVMFEIPERSVTFVAQFILLYTAGAYGGRWRDLTRGIVVALILLLAAYEIAFRGDELGDHLTYVPSELVAAYSALQNIFFLAAAWVLGDWNRSARTREAQLEAQAEALRRAQASQARQAVLQERVRIARELHDVVAHHVSVMGVQAGAARRMIDRRPDAVPELLSTVETSSRQAVDELQRMLGVLRQDESEAASAHLPTLAELPTLVDQVRAAGLRLTTDVRGPDGDPTLDLPPDVDRSTYRIVQEALTNTLKHAGPTAAARVSVRRRPDLLEVRVVDDGAGTDRSEPRNDAAGHGFIGMRERVAALGGDLSAGPRESGGFEVAVRLPLDGRREG